MAKNCWVLHFFPTVLLTDPAPRQNAAFSPVQRSAPHQFHAQYGFSDKPLTNAHSIHFCDLFCDSIFICSFSVSYSFEPTDLTKRHHQLWISLNRKRQIEWGKVAFILNSLIWIFITSTGFGFWCRSVSFHNMSYWSIPAVKPVKQVNKKITRPCIKKAVNDSTYCPLAQINCSLRPAAYCQ